MLPLRVNLIGELPLKKLNVLSTESLLIPFTVTCTTKFLPVFWLVVQEMVVEVEVKFKHSWPPIVAEVPVDEKVTPEMVISVCQPSAP